MVTFWTYAGESGTTLKNIGDMHRTGSGTDGLTDTQTDGGMDSATTICLPKFLWGHKTVLLKSRAHDCRKPSTSFYKA